MCPKRNISGVAIDPNACCFCVILQTDLFNVFEVVVDSSYGGSWGAGGLIFSIRGHGLMEPNSLQVAKRNILPSNDIAKEHFH